MQFRAAVADHVVRNLRGFVQFGADAVADSHLQRVAKPSLRHRLRRNPLDDTDASARVDRALAEVFAP